MILNFNPRVPCGTRQKEHETCTLYAIFQSTRPMRDATKTFGILSDAFLISIHASHAGRDHSHQIRIFSAKTFQSTRPMRDATLLSYLTSSSIDLYFNPRVPCGTRLLRRQDEYKQRGISIHASHAGRDKKKRQKEILKSISIHASHAGRD